MFKFLLEDKKWCDGTYAWGGMLRGMRSFIKICKGTAICFWLACFSLNPSCASILTHPQHLLKSDHLSMILSELFFLSKSYICIATFSKIGVTRELPLRCWMVKVFKHILDTWCLIKNPSFNLCLGNISFFIPFQQVFRERGDNDMERMFITKCNRWKFYIFLILGWAEK